MISTRRCTSSFIFLIPVDQYFWTDGFSPLLSIQNLNGVKYWKMLQENLVSHFTILYPRSVEVSVSNRSTRSCAEAHHSSRPVCKYLVQVFTKRWIEFPWGCQSKISMEWNIWNSFGKALFCLAILNACSVEANFPIVTPGFNKMVHLPILQNLSVAM